jgi:methylmalonyl-CoA mutase
MAPAASSLPIRIVTAASLFDGHDAAINVMRYSMQLRICSTETVIATVISI